MKSIIYLIAFYPLILFGQTTAIPDPNFEQALINHSSQICIDFEQEPMQTIPFNHSMEGDLVYSSNGINMYGTFIPHYSQFIMSDDIKISDAATVGFSNMISNIMHFGENGVVIDLSNLSYSSKSITFITNISAWQDSTSANPFLINGANESTLPINVNYSFQNIGTNYMVSITGNIDSLTIGGLGGAFDDFCVEPSSSSPTAINNISTDDKILLYPNPMTHSATIELPNDSEYYSLTIYDVLGNLVRTIENIHSKQLVIEREGLTNGVYLYQLSSSNNSFSGRIIIK